MRIAVACDDGQVSLHFGKCSEYRIFEVADGKVAGETTLPNPGHEPGVLPGFLASRGVNCIIAGGMGPRAVELFKQNNVEVVTGAMGEAGEVVRKYLDGALVLAKSSCEHHM